MRKVYSVMLMAFSLLVSANLWAIQGTDVLQEALDNAANGATITLDGNVTLTKAVNIYSGKTLTINLNGHSITGNFKNAMIYLYKGNLKITGEGSVVNTFAGDAGTCFQVEGQADHNIADWSKLEIDENVKVIAVGGTNDVYGKAIVVDGTVYGPYYTYLAQTIGEGRVLATDDVENYADYAMSTAKNKTSIGTNAGHAKYSMIGYANRFQTYKDVTTTLYLKNSATATPGKKYDSSNPRALAYGVKVIVKGYVHGGEYGIKNNGNVGLDAEGNKDNIAVIEVASTAKIEASTLGTSTAIASNGYGKFVINGTIEGGTGVYVKSGEVEIEDAVIASTYQGEFSDPVGKNSGINAGGSGIVIESNSSYNGGQDVTISGDTKVSGTVGYGIQETITTAATTEVSKVTVEGGTIEAGDQGAIIVSQGTKDEGKIEVVGGNVNNNIYVQGEGGEKNTADIEDFLPTEDNELYKTTAVTDPETGKTTIVVTKFDDIADMPVAANSVVAAVDNTGIEWTVTDDTEETLVADKTLTYLEAISAANKQILNVGDADHQVTLKVGRIVLGTKAQIIVAAGSRLIVDGVQGIVAPVVSNIVLSATEGSTSQFLFNPAVTSNRHPNATVEFITKSFRVDDTNKAFQRFGIPTHNQITEIESNPAIKTALYYYNWDSKNWINWAILNNGTAVDYSYMNKPFESYQMLTNAAAAGTVYKMKGEMVGNVNVDLEVGKRNWHAFANSYTGNIDVEALVNNGTYGNIYVYRRLADNSYVWDPVGKSDFDGLFGSPLATEIQPMQGFYVKATDANYPRFAIDYDGMLWTPATTVAAPAPRRAADQDITLARISVMNGNENVDNLFLMGGSRFTAEFEDGYDAEKLMNDGFNIFVSADEKMCKLATDNLEGAYLGVSAANAGYYTLNFSDINGEELVLVDLVNGSKTVMTEGASYQFFLAEGEANDYRFQIVGRQNMPTALENVENAANGNGIYSLTGQYMGNMSIWNTLPAGVYVVDGVKRVK